MEKILRSPITVGDQEVKSVILRDATGDDLRKLDDINDLKKFAQNLLLVEIVTGLPADAVGMMNGRDVLEIAEVAFDFLPFEESTPVSEGNGDPSSPTSPMS